MGRLREVKDFIDRQYTPSENIAEPYRSKMQSWMNVAKKAGYVTVSAAAVVFVADPVLSATGHAEMASIVNDGFLGELGAYVALHIGCVARIGVLEGQSQRVA